MPEPNTRLRAAMAEAGVGPAELARRVAVDDKTVDRWIRNGTPPRPHSRRDVSELLETDEAYLWPDTNPPQTNPSGTDLVQAWAARWQVPDQIWRSLLGGATQRIEVLAYAGTFLVEAYGLVARIRRLSQGSGSGSARILLGDPASDVLRRRGMDEGLPHVQGRASSMLEYLDPVRELPGVQVRVHDTPLFVSLYRFDDTMLVNQHTYGLPAKDNPVLQLRSTTTGDLFGYYEEAFERVWSASRQPEGPTP